jgi:enoyl-CoA hydratase/carnithine racemase
MTLPPMPQEPAQDGALCVSETLGATSLIWLNQPQKRNALSPELRVTLLDEIRKASEDDAIRVIVIAGTQGCFSAGGDISTMKGITAVAGRARMQKAADLMRAVIDCPKPIIAAVEGWSVGAGLSLSAACDIAISGRDAKYSLPFAKLGLMPDLASLYTIPARIGMGRTKWLAFTRRTIGAQQAMEWGLVEDVVDTGTALQHALAMADEIAQGAPLTNTYTKQMLARLPLPLPEFLAAERDAQAILYTSEDFAEGYGAFFEKRKPVFKGR